jgi:hypothetical protein
MNEDQFSSKFIEEMISMTGGFKSIPLEEAIQGLSKYSLFNN